MCCCRYCCCCSESEDEVKKQTVVNHIVTTQPKPNPNNDSNLEFIRPQRQSLRELPIGRVKEYGGKFIEYDNCDSDDDEQFKTYFEPQAYETLADITDLDAEHVRSHCLARHLDNTEQMYSDIETYLLNGQREGFTMKVSRILKIIQYNKESLGYDKKNRMLLWHGTKQNYMGGILQHGFRRPAHIPKHQMYGNGIYFADRSSKSSLYCDKNENLGYLFLVEVNLGNIHESYEAENLNTNVPHGYNSVAGLGKNIPDPSCQKMIRGALLPYGPTIPREDGNQSCKLLYNEFIIYDARRAVIRYLVEVIFEFDELDSEEIETISEHSSS